MLQEQADERAAEQAEAVSAAAPAPSEEPGNPKTPPAKGASMAGAGDKSALRTPSLSSWLRRVSSAGLSGSWGGSAAEADAAAAVQAADAAGARGGRHMSPVKSASQAALATHRQGLPAVLEDDASDTLTFPSLAAPSEAGADEAGREAQEAARAAPGDVSPGPRPPRPPSAGAASPAPPGSSAGNADDKTPAASNGLAEGAENGTPPASATPPLLSRLEALRGGGVGLPLVLFPDSPEGRLAQVTGTRLGRGRAQGCRSNLAGGCRPPTHYISSPTNRP